MMVQTKKKASPLRMVFSILSTVVDWAIATIMCYGAIAGHNAFGDGYTSFERQALWVGSSVLAYVAGQGLAKYTKEYL